MAALNAGNSSAGTESSWHVESPTVWTGYLAATSVRILEAGHIADAAVGDVPVPGDATGVVLVEHRIENRLLGEARREFPIAAGGNQRQFPGSHRTIEGDGVGIHFRAALTLRDNK